MADATQETFTDVQPVQPVQKQQPETFTDVAPIAASAKPVKPTTAVAPPVTKPAPQASTTEQGDLATINKGIQGVKNYGGGLLNSVGLPENSDEYKAGVKEATAKITPGKVAKVVTGAGPVIDLGMQAYGAGKNYLKGLWNTGKEAYEAGQNIAQGQPVMPNLAKPASAYLEANVGAIPFVGAPVLQGGKDFSAGNYAHGAGELTGAIAQLGFPKAVDKALPEQDMDFHNKAVETAQKKLDTANKAAAPYRDSLEKHVQPPKKVQAPIDKAQAELDEATFHRDTHRDAINARRTNVVNPPAAKPAPEVPTAQVEAMPLPGAPKATATPAAPQNIKLPGQVQPETFKQPLLEKPQVPVGPRQLPGGEPVGKMLQLGEGRPEGPQIPAGGLPKIGEVPAEAPKPAAKFEPGNVKTLKPVEGKVVDKETVPGSPEHLQKLIQEGLKPETKAVTPAAAEKPVQAAPAEVPKVEAKAAPVLPKEEAGYTPKKEKLIPTGEEGREEAKSAAAYHPAVQAEVGNLSNSNLDKLATAHGIDPTAPEYSRSKEMRSKATDTSSGRHQIGRDKLAADITEQMSDDEKTNIGRNAERLNTEGTFQNKDMTGKSKAERAESLFPRLRGPVDEAGNPKVSGGSQDVESTIGKIATEHNKSEGLPELKTEKVDKTPRGKEIADAYAAMKHDPTAPEVKKSYKALIDDTKKQWNALEKAGIKIEPTDADPYKSYEEMHKDMQDNKRLKVFRGGNPLPEDHPLAAIDPKTGESYNTMFRAVHDAFGHGAQGHDFSEPGEENAWNVHRQMMSPEAVPAMTTETRGQTSWFFNHGEKPGEFAEQKAGILPDFANQPTPNAKEALDHIKSGKDYAVLTAENPNNTRATPEENAKRNRELVADLKAKGYEAVPVEGNTKDVEGNKEHSFFVKGIKPEEAAELGRKHGQAAVLTTEGLHDLKTDTVNPSDNKKLMLGDEARKQDYYTKVGDKDFSVPIDFDKTVKPGEATFSGERRSTERKAPLNAKETEAAMQNREPFTNPFDETKRAKATIESDKNMPKHPAEEAKASGKADNYQGEPMSYEQTQDQHHIVTKDDSGKKIGELVAKDSAPGTVEVLSNQIYDKNLQGKGRGADQIQHLLNNVGNDTHTVKSDISTSDQARAAWDKVQKFAPDAVSKNEFKDGQVQYTVDMSKWRGENLPTVSGGSPAAGTATAKEGKFDPLSEEHLTPEEKAGLSKSAVARRNYADNMAKLPPLQEWVDAAKGGEGAKDWYMRSRQAFKALRDAMPNQFKPEDGERWANFVASLSPRQMVHRNLAEAIHAWSQWTADGRPMDDAGMEKSLRDAIASTPDTKVPNAMKALQGKEMWPDLTKNRNFKVPSFGKNLSPAENAEVLKKYMNFTTNDGWQALFGGLDEKKISSPSSYHPLSVMTRAAAKELGWEPEQAQAAIWSFTQALKERGEVDPQYVREYSEDFADILAENAEIRNQLKELGVDLGQLDEKLKAVGHKPEVTPGASSTTEHSTGQLASRIEAARGKGAIPEPKQQTNFSFREPQANEGRTRIKDEGTEFNPEEFGNEEPLIKPGEKKKPGIRKM